MKLLVFAGALRADSCNKKFVREALRLAKESGADGEFIDLKDYPMPVYDGDIEAASGIPETVKALGGTRSMWHTRQPFEVLGVHMFPNMMALPNAYNAFDAAGKLNDEKTVTRLKSTIEQFIKHVKG